LAGDSGGQEPRANVGKKAVSEETAFFYVSIVCSQSLIVLAISVGESSWMK